MKNLKFILAGILITCLINSNYAQSAPKSKLALIEIDTRSLKDLSSFKIADMPVTAITRLELEKLGRYSMIDQYDLEYLAKRDNLSLENCFSTYCIADIAGKLQCDKVFTGSVSKIGEKLVITYKIYDTKIKDFEKVIVKEFLYLPNSLPSMIRITLNEMFGVPNDKDEVNTLTNNFIFDESRNNPFTNRLRADGPRMGLTLFTGTSASILKKDRKDGGFAANPVMFQFGYQFEKQYLNQGNFQALFEVVPMLTGLDQGMFIPSITVLNGMRNNKNGWEFAFGPSIGIIKTSKGYYDDNNDWHLSTEVSTSTTNPFIERRLDSRGNLTLHPSFIFALGKTFKSGKLNIPVNAYFIPSKEGYRFGFSFGFNSRARYENPSENN